MGGSWLAKWSRSFPPYSCIIHPPKSQNTFVPQYNRNIMNRLRKTGFTNTKTQTKRGCCIASVRSPMQLLVYTSSRALAQRMQSKCPDAKRCTIEMFSDKGTLLRRKIFIKEGWRKWRSRREEEMKEKKEEYIEKKKLYAEEGRRKRERRRRKR